MEFVIGLMLGTLIGGIIEHFVVKNDPDHYKEWPY